ncbi:ferredoxin [Saccharopolyspora sp. K220]|uniref:ferredoxin n=1 Tax=Saccharopolyspora soli TaxID=2926618 RepID=UPI001F5AE8DE|nr:ferredoxin [Saccharopolyspora soli]MCI2422565.1 ferredoxin [Saccharopolyspora soli]
MKVEVQADKCIASGQCVLLSDVVFDQDDEEGIVVLRTSEVPESEQSAVREAERICPARAIRLAGSGG